MDEKIKTWTLRFLAKENSIVLQYDVEAKYRLISRKFSGMWFFHRRARLTNKKPHTFVISVRLLLLFCSRVFISRSYENRSKLRSPTNAASDWCSADGFD